MAVKRSHHFVPKFYLRNFCSDSQRKTIGLYHFSSNTRVDSAPIKSQASSKWLYGKDGELEDAFSIEESQWARMCQIIIKHHALPPSDSIYMKLLKRFIMLQNSRTLASQKLLDSILDTSLRKVMSYDSKLSKYDDIHFRLKDSIVMGMDAVLKGMWITDDLTCKLIVNVSDQPFITSDHPVIRYNQFLELHKHPFGTTGVAIRGVQVFFPISPIHHIVMYDGGCYKIGDRKKSVVLANSSDVRQLNRLQVLNSDNHIYFSHLAENQFEELKGYRSPKTGKRSVSMDEVGRRELPNGEGSVLLHAHIEEYRIRLNLSFSKLTDKAKHYQNNGEVVVLRNPSFAVTRRIRME